MIRAITPTQNSAVLTPTKTNHPIMPFHFSPSLAR